MRVTVHFIGICTHISNPEPAGSASSVVLVDGHNGLSLGDVSVPPHLALLCIPKRFLRHAPERIEGLTWHREGTWIMSGVRLRLGHSDKLLTWAPSYGCLPSLTAYAQQPLALSVRVINAGDAACVFSVPSGTLEAYVSEKPSRAMVGKLTLDTDGAAKLFVTRIWDKHGSSIELQCSETGEAPHIFVANVGKDVDGKDIDGKDDFLLHYGVTTWTPDRPINPEPECPVPPTDADMKAVEEADRLISLTGLTFGCSNAGWP
jgi:hypothetical protein